MTPREPLAILRGRELVSDGIEADEDTLDLLTHDTNAPVLNTDGVNVLQGTREVDKHARIRKRKRNRYATKLSQVARATVGYLSNTPENRMIYQKVIMNIMEKDCVRYVDRDMLLPIAVGMCFIYDQRARDAAALWRVPDSIGIK
jgi:hypothetical protein